MHHCKALSSTGSLVFVLSCILCLLSSNAHSQPAYTAQLWPISDKLSQQTIYSVLQATDGTLWIATLAGIDRYNGVDFYEYRTHKMQEGHISSSQIFKLMESSSGEIYAATIDSGLLLFRESENRFERVELDSDPNHVVSRLTAAYFSSAGELWMGYENGDVVRYSPASSAVGSIRLSAGHKITGLGETHSGEVLAASASGDIFEISVDLDASRAIPMTQSCLDKFSELGEITAADQGLLWLATRGDGPLLLDMASGTCSSPSYDAGDENELDHAVIHDIHFDSISKSALIASDQGLFIVDSKLNAKLISTEGSRALDTEVVSISRGKGDLFWIGTYTGLHYLVPTVFETNAKFAEGKLHSIVAIDSFADSSLWIASYDGLLFREGTSPTHQGLASILPGSTLVDGKIMTIEVDSQGIWIGYRATGLQYIEFADASSLHVWSTTEGSPLSSNSVSAILPHENGRTLVGTYGGGVNIVSLTGDTEVFSVGDNHVIFLHRTADGAILVGTESGTYQLDIHTGHAVKLRLLESDDSSQTKPVIWDIVDTESGDMWLATMHHGLFVSSDEHQKAISVRTFIPVPESAKLCSTAYAIEVDSEGYIWCSTNSGLVRIPRNFS